MKEEIKLTDKQKKVIKLLLEGKTLKHSRFIGYSSISFSDAPNFVNKNTVRSLITKNILSFGEKLSYSTYTYKLTELGKSINIEK